MRTFINFVILIHKAFKAFSSHANSKYELNDLFLLENKSLSKTPTSGKAVAGFTSKAGISNREWVRVGNATGTNYWNANGVFWTATITGGERIAFIAHYSIIGKDYFLNLLFSNLKTSSHRCGDSSKKIIGW